MVNRLLRMRHRQPEGRARVLSLSRVAESIGNVTIEPGECGWVGWSAALSFVRDGLAQVVEYEAVLVEPAELMGEAIPTNLDETPGFFCQECLEQGRYVRFASEARLYGHIGSHRPGHGWPRGRPHSKKKIREIERREKQRNYMREYHKRHRDERRERDGKGVRA